MTEPAITIRYLATLFLPIVIGGFCLAVGALHIAVGLYDRSGSITRRRNRTYLLFGLSACFIAGSAFLEPLVYYAQTLSEMVVAFKWMIGFQVAFWLAALWFIVFLTDPPFRWLAYVATGAIVFGGFIIHVLSPGGILYSEVTGIQTVHQPWLDPIRLPTGPANPWRLMTDATLLLFFVIGGLGCRQLFKRGDHYMAVLVTGALALLFLGNVQSSLVDIGLIEAPYLLTLGFFGPTILMGVGLVSEIMQKTRIARELNVQQEHWQTLIDRVRLAIVRVDRNGIVVSVNPFVQAVTGLERGAFIGRSFRDLLPQDVRPEVEVDWEAGNLREYAEMPVVTEAGSPRLFGWSNVVLSDKEGAFDGVLAVGADISERVAAQQDLEAKVRELRELKDQLKEENILLLEQIVGRQAFEGIVGGSPALRYALSRVEEVAPTETAVLLEGETGVGKDLLARAIHKLSSRSDRPLLKVDCASLPPNLLEAELFGHEKGAFTGADRSRKGRFELANGGTVFLDEIGELPLEMQPKLLRVLQEGKFERLGSERTTSVDLRVIAATNRDLWAEVNGGRFRGDLFFRLSVFPISVPPLRQRKEDIPLLVAFFVGHFARKHGKQVRGVPISIMERMCNYEWPGNIRELQNVIERAVIMTRDGQPLRVRDALTAEAESSESDDFKPAPLDQIEKEHILKTLEFCSWKVSGQTGAATLLGMNPSTLRSRMLKLGIRRSTRMA